MLEEICLVVSETLHLPRNAVHSKSSKDNLAEWDSLNHLEVVLALERQFKVQFNAVEFGSLTSVEKIEQVLIKKSLEK